MFKNKIIIGMILLILIIVIISIISIYYKKYKIKNQIIDIIENTPIIEEYTIIPPQFDSILKQENIIGILEIPSIKLKAPICNSTSQEALKKYIGHFENTPQFDGNVGLAAHKWGFQYNYFENIDKLKPNDIISYKTLQGTKKYHVDRILEIYENDWSYLNSTTKDTLTLITCIKGKPNYRLCVKATVR